jgi:predicted nucleic acid-binding protein
MAHYYFDASALVKYYVREAGSTWVRELIDARTGEPEQPVHTVFVADISAAEVTAAFAVLQRTHRIGHRLWNNVFDRFMADVYARYQLVPAGRDDFFAAAHLTRHHPLKAYDAVQMAVARRYSRALFSTNLPLTLVSGDGMLLAAARAEGLSTDNPFDHQSPQDTSPGSANPGDGQQPP